tara:strand:+ start:390 stop:839 length:450 start_codon:yes stop_codon:yes gene_type:complete
MAQGSGSSLLPSNFPLTPGLKELLQSCLQREGSKRIPASVLIASPWFAQNGINDLSDSVTIMRNFVERTFGTQDMSLVSMSLMESLTATSKGGYGNVDVESHKRRMRGEDCDVKLSRDLSEMNMSVDDYKSSNFSRRIAKRDRSGAEHK